MAVLFVFIDGIGIGRNDPENPLASSSLRSFSEFTGCNGFHEECPERLEEQILYKKIDANLGVKGLPQSGTGQVTLFSGENASKLIGRHFGPYPYSKTKPLLHKRSLFHKVIEAGKNPFFLNAYPDIFFKNSSKRDRWTSTTLMARSAGVKLNREQDLKEGRAVTAEIVQSAWKHVLEVDVPEITPEEASGRALQALEGHDLVLFEYYKTDKAGHEMNRKKADRVLSVLDRFLKGVMDGLSEKDTLVITSDHGNLEDLSVKTHTRNPVPLFVKGDTEPFKNVKSIVGITPAIMEILA